MAVEVPFSVQEKGSEVGTEDGDKLLANIMVLYVVSVWDVYDILCGNSLINMAILVIELTETKVRGKMKELARTNKA